MTVLAGAKVVSLAERGFIPRRPNGDPISEKTWRITVENCSSLEWGICPMCHADTKIQNQREEMVRLEREREDIAKGIQQQTGELAELEQQREALERLGD